VISPKLDEIVDYILHDLHSGATLNEITGAYDKTPRKEVITIVDKHEYRKLMDLSRLPTNVANAATTKTNKVKMTSQHIALIMQSAGKQHFKASKTTSVQEASY
jgi:hypothetical protein